MKGLAAINFASSKVLVAGDVMADTYWVGQTSRISPEAPVPVVLVEFEETRPGGAANVALNIVALGARTTLVGLVGDDAIGGEIARLLTQQGIDHSLIRVAGARTIRKLRVMSRRQQLIRMDFEQRFENVSVKEKLSPIELRLPDNDILVLSDYAKGFLGVEAQELISLAKAHKKIVIVDPKGTDFRRYTGATLITPNLAEFEAVVGPCGSDQDIVERGINLCKQLQLDSLLVTRGEHGMTLLEQNAAPFHLESRAREVFDVTGAGDTVVATLAAVMGSGASLREAVELANVAAGIVVAKSGTATASVGELVQSQFATSPSNQLRKVVELGTLREIISSVKIAGKSAVMTNGCFDVLHAGHVDLLRRARELGDLLVVAVNDDASVRRLKGATRPVNPLEHRLTVLSMLECVDYLVVFSEDTPEKLYCRVLPQVLVKGGDYTAAQVAGGNCVTAAGGRIAILDLVPDLSSTHILSKLGEFN
ncbi:MAG: bifunctional D-glycero-beta-D-manno-heptose-7-phosphate kinase/D-glycero-beta-D-manno-heptose 1-phosphate adenylyltransferase HldE [Gammaproteobacteria bacterium]|nr:bifunctional D-glycero-beta-D-manno-heptose-7-phosphate kinase/D-glycero-beta-D-manno-heptose 1-phosphate adenylyltransferase HldE [Gammaproteobacteria bacterium]